MEDMYVEAFNGDVTSDIRITDVSLPLPSLIVPGENQQLTVDHDKTVTILPPSLPLPEEFNSKVVSMSNEDRTVLINAEYVAPDLTADASESYETPLLPPPPPPLPDNDTPEPYETPLDLFLPPPPLSPQDDLTSASNTNGTSEAYEIPVDLIPPSSASPPVSDTPDEYENPLDIHAMPNEDIQLDTDGQSLYEDMTVDEDPTYDDLPDNVLQTPMSNNESYVQILPSGDVVMSTTQSSTNRAPDYLTARESSASGTIQLTGFQPLSNNEAPPSYDALFGQTPQASSSAQSTIPRVVSPQRVSRDSAAPLVRQAQSPVPLQESSPDNETNWCLHEVYGSPLKTGMYLFLFLIGVFVPLGMLGLGIGIFLTSSSDNKMVPIYFIIMGCFSSFFVFWHTIALIAGSYIKSRNINRRHSASSCCLRVLHLGALLWIGATGFLSYCIWPGVVSSGLNSLMETGNNEIILPIVLLGFLAFQYLMILYCFCEFFIDCFICCNKQVN